MTPAEGRAIILAQHAELRALLERAVVVARQHLAGTASDGELEAVVGQVRAAFSEHNLFETSLLRPLLRDVDRWGEDRIRRMIEEHIEEHRVIEAFLAGSAEAIAHDLADFVEDMDAHMLAEERTFLSPTALPER